MTEHPRITNEAHNKSGARRLLLCGALALACAPCALAQSSATAKGAPASKPVAAGQPATTGPPVERHATVRERRAVKSAESVAKDEAKIVESKTTGKGEAAKSDEAAVATKPSEKSVADELKTKIKDARDETERARLRRELADHLVAQGRKDEAVAELREFVGVERVDPAGFYNAGNALARLDESNAAVNAYRKAIAQRRGNYSRAQNNLGVVLIRLGRWEEAREALAAAIRLEGVYPEASYNLGRLHALRGEAGLAIKEWERALARQPEHAEAAIALARGLAEDGDPNRALSILDKFAKRFTLRGERAPRSIEIARGEIVAAINVAEELERAAPPERASKPLAPARTGEVAVRAPSAKPLRALAVDQETYDILRRARVARDNRRHEEAVALYRRVIERQSGYFPPANLELGFSLYTLGRDPEAIEAFRAVTAKDGSRYPIAFYHLGRLYEATGDLARSRESFERATALYGEGNPQLLLDLSRVREKEGDTRGALEAMEGYVRTTARMGGTPEFAHESLARLRQKLAPAVAPAKQ